MSAVLRPAPHFDRMVEGDINDVMEIENRIYAFAWTPGNFRDSIRAGYDCWVCREAGRMIGYSVVALAAQEAHLLNLSIDVSHQRRGHGSRMLQHVLGTLRACGARLLFLEVRPSNGGGRELYAKHGFRQVAVRRGYYPAQDGREDALLLALDL